MPAWRRCGYLLFLLVPCLPVGAALLLPTGAWAAWLPLLVLFGVLPVLDLLLGEDHWNPADAAEEERLSRESWFRLLPLLALPAYALLLPYSVSVFVTLQSPVAQVGWLLSQGVVGGIVAINSAHELIHRQGRLERTAGGLLLAMVGYGSFKIEHLRGHHVRVATPADASSAARGTSVYRFVPRAIWRNLTLAWQLESAALRRAGLPFWRHEVLGWSLVTLLLATASWLWLGSPGLCFFLGQGLVAIASLEVINYIEHYGLRRAEASPGRPVAPTRMHAWNANAWLSNCLLLQLQRHADHHTHPRRRYQVLHQHPDSPQLPCGYAGLFLIALLPPLWRWLMHPRLDALPAEALGKR